VVCRMLSDVADVGCPMLSDLADVEMSSIGGIKTKRTLSEMA